MHTSNQVYIHTEWKRMPCAGTHHVQYDILHLHVYMYTSYIVLYMMYLSPLRGISGNKEDKSIIHKRNQKTDFESHAGQLRVKCRSIASHTHSAFKLLVSSTVLFLGISGNKEDKAIIHTSYTSTDKLWI